MKKTIMSGLLLTLISHSAFAQQKASFPKYMFSEKGCSESYFQKARKTNKIVGFGAGAFGIVGATIFPLSAVFLIGGLATAGETGYTYLEESEQANKKKMAPRVRYPIARQYYDINNALELNKIIKSNQANDLAQYIPMYMDAILNSQKANKQYKECKSVARTEGVSRSEAKQIEKDIMKFLVAIEEEQDTRNLTVLESAKKSLANCLLEIEVDETYPIADLLLLRNELSQTNLMSWRFKSSIRFFSYVVKKANQQNKSITATKFFEILTRLDDSKSICEVGRKPLNRKRLANEIISLLK